MSLEGAADLFDVDFRQWFVDEFFPTRKGICGARTEEPAPVTKTLSEARPSPIPCLSHEIRALRVLLHIPKHVVIVPFRKDLRGVKSILINVSATNSAGSLPPPLGMGRRQSVQEP